MAWSKIKPDDWATFAMGTVLLVVGVITALSVQASETTTVVSPQVSRLIERIDRYNRLVQARRYNDSYEMVSQWWTESPADRREWVGAGTKMDNGIRILSWEIKQVHIDGSRARVRMAIHSKSRRTLLKWEESVEDEDDFWIFEKDDWYYIPLILEDWNDAKAVEVPVPKRAPEVNINKKD